MVKISFLGDISLNDEYNALYENGLNPFQDVSDTLKQSDFVVGNLECLARGNKGENIFKKPRLKTNLETLNFLKNLNLGLVTLAHNHIYDNLFDGYQKTTRFLQRNGISYIGAGISENDARKPFFKEIEGQKFCFLNYVTLDTNPIIPEDSELFLNIFEETKVIEEIRKFRKENRVILLLHWGGKFEEALFSDFEQMKIARRLIDEGANLIIGHHSHTYQNFEKYNGKYIFYSLGNFCFADIQSDDKIKEVKMKKYLESVIVQISFSESDYDIHLRPIKNTNLFIHFDNKLNKKFKRRHYYLKIISQNKLFWYLYKLYYQFIEPILVQITRKDKDRSLIVRMKELNYRKIKQLFSSNK